VVERDRADAHQHVPAPGRRDIALDASDAVDPAAAWEVVEKMGALGWKFGMVQDGTLWDVNTYNPDVRPSCAFCGHTPSGAINASAPTVPLAICRAALKAVEK